MTVTQTKKTKSKQFPVATGFKNGIKIEEMIPKFLKMKILFNWMKINNLRIIIRLTERFDSNTTNFLKDQK